MSNSSRFVNKQLFVTVLAPQVHTADDTIAYYYDFSTSIDEFIRAFAALKIDWCWQPVTLQNFKQSIDEIRTKHSGKQMLFFNVCDGDEANGIPGISVINYLEKQGLPYTGAKKSFYQISTSKIVMKTAFDAAGVSTAPWFGIESSSFKLNGEFHDLPKPILVKPAVSAGSLGLGVRNVVQTEEELTSLVKELYNGCHGWEISAGGFVAESFIKGREFTCFLIGEGSDVFAYPPIELVFHQSLPETEKFLSFDRLWEFYEGEAPIGDYEDLYNFSPVDESLATAIASLSRKAYKAVNGTGYGRVDLRMDAATGTLYVLEVNAQCGLSEDEAQTSIGAILRYAKEPYATMLLRIIRHTLKRKRKKKTSAGQPTLFSAYLSA